MQTCYQFVIAGFLGVTTIIEETQRKLAFTYYINGFGEVAVHQKNEAIYKITEKKRHTQNLKQRDRNRTRLGKKRVPSSLCTTLCVRIIVFKYRLLY